MLCIYKIGHRFSEIYRQTLADVNPVQNSLPNT